MNIDEVFHQSVECAISTLAAVIGKNAQMGPAGVEIVPRLVNREPIVINMGFCNDNWQGLLTLGGTHDDLLRIIGDESLELVVDALGEVLNGTAGTIAALPASMQLFGELSQTTPVVMEGGAFFPRAPSVQVDLLFEDAKLRFGFAIRQVNT